MKIFRHFFHFLKKFIRGIFVFIRKALLAQCIVMGNIFGKNPIVKDKSAKTEVSREKD